MLKQRVITALSLAAVFLGGIFFLPAQGFIALVTLPLLLAAWEWSDLTGLRSSLLRGLYTALIALLLGASYHFSGLLDGSPNLVLIRDILGAAALWWCIALLWVKGYPSSAILWGSSAARAVMGVLVLVPAWLAVAYLRTLEQGQFWIIFLVALVAAADIGAYFTGRAWGKSKLAVAVSPGKSWAGFWGGLATVGLLSIAVALFAPVSVALPALLVAALFTGLASVLGDLLESMVKRHRGIKDSSQMLPGHGGFLDRLDSITAAAPVFALSMILMGG